MRATIFCTNRKNKRACTHLEIGHGGSPASLPIDGQRRGLVVIGDIAISFRMSTCPDPPNGSLTHSGLHGLSRGIRSTRKIKTISNPFFQFELRRQPCYVMPEVFLGTDTLRRPACKPWHP